MAKLIIQNFVDWGRSFVDINGTFYSGTTKEEKDIAYLVAKDADLWIYLVDIHPRLSSEFIANGGLYPVHNLIKKDWYDLDSLGIQKGKTVSPELTNRLQELVQDKPSGLIVPRHVFFQDYDGGIAKPCFSYRDIEDTFGVKRMNHEEFLDGKIRYVINAKHMFNGAALQATERLGHFQGIPTIDMNIFGLLKEKYGQGESLVINHTGVVAGICIYQTASGVKQLFPKAEVNIIADGMTHLLVAALGFSDIETSNFAMKKMCQQVGINYITSKEYLRAA
jgi:hypothetical protein